MNAWSNIEVTPGDNEISRIDKMEEALGEYPENIKHIRELITRFEVCHFKYQQHFKNIKDSIRDLKPKTQPASIGQNHIKQGEAAWKHDKTGRSLMAQQYIWAMNIWLNDKYFTI